MGAAAVCAVAFWFLPSSVQAAYEPHVAVVLCGDTYEVDWWASHQTSQGLVGLAGLAGVPYDTLMLNELLALDEVPYTSIWFSACFVVREEAQIRLRSFLRDFLARDGTVFLDGPLAAFHLADDGNWDYRGMGATVGSVLGLDDQGSVNEGYVIETSASRHPITARAGLEPFARLSQGVAGSTEVIAPASDRAGGASQVLLEFASPMTGERFPYLTLVEPELGGAVLAVSDYGRTAGAATPFRNREPSGFYDNRVLPYLVDALIWTMSRGEANPVGLQLSHAPMTAVVRIDGDWSGNAPAVARTLDYAQSVAEMSGVASVYGVVSSFAEEEEWRLLRDAATALLAQGSEFVSHTHTHPLDMSVTMTSEQWPAETRDSIDSIWAHIGDNRRPVRGLINPGETIRSDLYHYFWSTVDLFMTHGFEVTVPYAVGAMSFSIFGAPGYRAVINNTPIPDFAWFYDTDWTYSGLQAAELQAHIADYFYQRVGRGHLYNMMWHDYAIFGTQPVNVRRRHVRDVFDVNAHRFANNKVYAPAVAELVAKLHAARTTRFRSTTSTSGSQVRVDLDYSAVPLNYRDAVAGMGLRINLSEQQRHSASIVAVTVDGADYRGFTDDTVILPRPTGARQHVVAELGGAQERVRPRLTYVSKPHGDLRVLDGTLTFNPKDSAAPTKFCVDAGNSAIALNAANQLRTRTELCGCADGATNAQQGAPVQIRALPGSRDRFQILAADVPIVSASFDGGIVRLGLDGSSGQVQFFSPARPIAATIAGVPAALEYERGVATVAIETGGKAVPTTLEIELGQCAAEGDCHRDVELPKVAAAACAPVSALEVRRYDASPGCSCRIPPPRTPLPTGSALLAALGAAAAVLLRRRRRSRTGP
jgi:MYXO-CTERM domain-containing protein